MNCKEYIEQTILLLTGSKPDVIVDEDEHGAVITLKVFGNVSALIGKNGITVDALRTLIKAIGYNGKHRIKVRVHEQRTN